MDAEIRKCGKTGCDPKIQVRGEMGAGNYHPDEVPLSHDVETYHTKVEMNPDIETDVRIHCAVCGRTSGWSKADAPGAPGALKDYLVKQWNESVGQ